MFNRLFNHLKTTILLLGSGLTALTGLASCDNFLNSSLVLKEIEDSIAYSNAKEITVLIQGQEGIGTTLPSGNYKAKQGYEFEISFSEAQGYSFQKWVAVSKDDPSIIITDGIFFADEKSSKTKIKITNDKIPLRLIPECTDRIAVSGQPSPQPNQTGVGWDRPIYVEFTKELLPQSFIFSESELPQGAEPVYDSNEQISAYTLEGQTYFKNISITSADGFSLSRYFLPPATDGKYLTVEADKLNRIPFAVGEVSKTIIVTLKNGISGTDGVSMSAEKTWRYMIVDASDDKAAINFTASSTEGLLNAVSGSYSVGQTINLTFTENADYQFVRWDYDSSIVKIKEPEKADTTITVFEKTTGTQSSQVKAVCAPRPRVVENGLTPVSGSTVPKNSAIQITFDHNLPVESNGSHPQLENISITMAGNPVKSSFLTPSIIGGTVTFVADYSNMLEVPSGQTKTVTVTIPADFYYELDDEAKTKVYYGGNGKTWNYKINEKTNEETTITFVTNNADSGTITKGPRQDTVYSLGERIDIAFVLDENYQFNGWKIYDKDNNELSSGADGIAAVTVEDPSSLTTKLNVNAEVQGIKVVADTSMKLFVTDVAPDGQINNKDCDIAITLSKPLDSNCTTPEFLAKISVKLNGTPVDQYFETRSVEANKIILKNTKYLNVTENEIKTISIFVPQDYYYKDRNITVNLGQSFNYEYQVNSSTTKKVNVNYTTATAASGSINQNPNVSYNIGDTVDLKFDLAEGFQFTFWQIVDQNGDAVGNDKIKIDDAALTDTKMHILAPVEGNVSVIAKAFLVPKITSIYPPFESFGSDQDSTIEITFNKAVDAQTFGDFSCITISDIAGEKLALYGSVLESYNQSHTSNPFSAYYEEPYFSPDNKILYIPTVKGKYLINKNSSDTKDIIVNINLSQVKDKQGTAFETFAPYTYRVNKNMDNVPPTLTSAEVFSTSDITSSYYKQLTDKAFVEWNTSSHDGYTYGDYSQNHVSRSVYIQLDGFDVGNGVDKIQVTETYHRAVDGSETQDTPHTYLLDFTKIEEKFCATYTMHSINDGIIKLEFALLDYSELPSNKKAFFVLKDTVVDEQTIKFVENRDPSTVAGYRDVSDSNEDEITLTPYTIGNTDSKDIFYTIGKNDYLASFYDIHVYWGYSKDSFPYKAIKNGNINTFTRDGSKFVFMKIVCYDDVGNILETIRPMPPQPDFNESCIHLKSDESEPLFTIIPYDYDILETIKNEQISLRTVYLFYAGGEKKGIIDSIYLENNLQGLDHHNSIQIDVLYDVYISMCFYYPGFNYCWYSPKSRKSCKMKFKASGYYKILDEFEFIDSNSTIVDDDYFNSSPSITFTELHNTGQVNVSIENYQHPLNDCSGCSYFFKCQNKDSGNITVSNKSNFNLVSPASYYLFIEARDVQGNTYRSSQSKEFTLTQDVTSPVFSNVSNYPFEEIVDGIKHPVKLYVYTSSFYKEYFVPRDEGNGAKGLLTTEDDNKIIIDYYLIPDSVTNTWKYTAFSLQELQTTYKDYKQTLFINLDDESYIIPFDGREEGHYTLCEVVWDRNENYAIHYQGVLNKTFGKKAEFSFTLNSETDDSNRYRLKCADTLLDNCIMYTYDSDNGIWKEDIDIHGYYGVTIPKTKFEDKWVKIVSCESSSNVYFSGFYDVEYMYPDYHKGLVDPDAAKITCENKNIIDGKNGIQVFCDASTFAHTMYCSKLLSQDKPQVWENKAMETGVVIKNNNFTYSADNYDGVPKGAYYCTIVHFADGDMLMSDVKFKEK